MEHTTVRRLSRSSREKVFAGVCGGIAEYLGVDPVLVRVLYIALTLFTNGLGIILYLIAWIIVPLDTGERAPRHLPSGRVRRVTALVLISLGALGLLAYLMFQFSDIQVIGPILIILAGVIMLAWRGDADANDATYTEIPPTGTNTQSSSSPKARRLYRIDAERKIAGVCAGIAKYFNVDPTIVRLLTILLTLLSVGSGILIYIIMWFVIPLDIESQPSVPTT